MGWFQDMWNYHPSLPMKRMQWVEDLQEMGSNLIIWSSLGSGAIGLPYLYREAFESIPPRLRLYGFLNDSEFCQECAQRGIKVFSVLWKAQLWEFPAEFNKDESELVALNILRNKGEKKGWIGMSELSTDRYPKIFKSIKEFFPNGLKDSDGKNVTDFLEEFKAQTLDGNDIYSQWLMVPDHTHRCYSPCGNKNTYLTYLKKNVEIMIDAGNGGLHIDEFDTQRYILINAGCFCKDCMKGFCEYLRRSKKGLPEDVNLETFDYGKYLKDSGYSDRDLFPKNGRKRFKIPLYKDFYDFQMLSNENNVRDLSSHAKAYSREKRGVTIPVTANLFNFLPHTSSSKKYLDIISGEKSNIQLRQDEWYKFGFGYCNGKESCLVEDPNDYILKMVEEIRQNIHDRFILFYLEPLAHGFHIAMPFGSWLINKVKDSFWPDLRVAKKIGQWLKKNETLFPAKPVADIAVLYDNRIAHERQVLGATYEERNNVASAFMQLGKILCENHILYNVIFASDDEPLEENRLKGYGALLLPDSVMISGQEINAITSWREKGGKVISIGQKSERIETNRHFRSVKSIDLLTLLREQSCKILAVEGNRKIGIALHKTSKGFVLHLVNYNMNNKSGRIRESRQMSFTLGWEPGTADVTTFPENSTTAELKKNTLVVRRIGIYTIVHLK